MEEGAVTDPPDLRQGGPTGAAHAEEARTVCPVCLSTVLHPDNQCTLRCGHALCNLCLPQLLSPHCPLCRRSIWREETHGGAVQAQLDASTPWLLDAGTMLLGAAPEPAPAPPLDQDDAMATDDMSTFSTEDSNIAPDQIPVLLLTRAQVRSMFGR